MDDISVFGMVERPVWDNAIPDSYSRKRSPFWRMAGKLLGLPAEEDAPIDDTDGANAAIRQIRAWEALRSLPRPTLGDLAADIVDEVKEAAAEAVKVAIRTKHDAATWLKTVLADGGKPQKEVEALAKAAGIATRTLRRGKQLAGVVARKVGRTGWEWMIP